MSVLVTRDITCPYCQHPNETEVWSSINVREDPELKDVLLGGELNMTECEACHEIFYAENFLLYHDPDDQLMAFVYPVENAADRAVWEEKTTLDYAASQATVPEGEGLRYPPLSLFGLDDLVRLVERDDEIKLQGEIVETLAKQGAFSIRTLSPVDARAGEWPRVLPVSGDSGGSDRDRVLAGLHALKAVNDRLFIYTRLLERLEKSPSLVPPLPAA